MGGGGRGSAQRSLEHRPNALGAGMSGVMTERAPHRGHGTSLYAPDEHASRFENERFNAVLSVTAPQYTD